jgi:signal transduction histidine kinase/ActR/RegA family two-component response regulator
MSAGRLLDRLMFLAPMTFRRQAILFIASTLLLLSAVYTVESISTERKILRTEILKRGETIALIAARNAEIPILSENQEQLRNSARTVLEIQDVSFVEYRNRRYETLFRQGGKHAPEGAPPVDDGKPVHFSEHGDLFEFRVPVVTVRTPEEMFLFDGASAPAPARELVGWVRVGISKGVFARTERTILLRGGILAVLFSFAGILLAYRFVARATRPLQSLVDAVKHVRRGEHTEVPVLSPDNEFGLLSVEFNRMSRAIREREEALRENLLELEQTIEAKGIAEAELRLHRDHLEDLVAERTAQLTVAKEQAETATRAKSDFLSRMSHELRTPLNAVLGYVQIIRRQENLTDEQRRQLGVVHGSGEHLLTLINDILDVGRIEAAGSGTEDHAFDLPELLGQVFNLTRLLAEEKSLDFRLEADPALPGRVRGDERKLRQILLNLLGNAVKYTPKGSITLRAAYGSAPDGPLRCEVADTGIGIPPDKIDAIFEPFVQLGSGGQPREGAGLGLDITRRLVGLMGGTIAVESEPGKGSVFRFEVGMPAIRDDVSALERGEHHVVGYAGDRKRILVVDDIADNTGMLSSLLEPLGFDVDTARSGDEALARMRERRPDLVLMDLVMPGMNGFEAVTEIRRSPDFSSIRVVGTSATVTESVDLGAFAAACDDFVPKPIRIDTLLAIMGSMLGIRWETRRLDGPAPAENGAARDDSPIEAPPPSELGELHELALRGDMAQVARWAESLALRDARYGRFAARLRGLADGFRTRAVLEMVESCRRSPE